MSNQHHRRLHGRQGPAEAWSRFQKDFKDVAHEVNPFEQNTTPSLQARAPAPSTIWVTQLTTLKPTFQGEIGGYTTMVDDNNEPTKTKAISALADPTKPAQHRTTMGVGPPPRFDATPSTTLPESLVPTATSDIADHTTLAVASPIPTAQRGPDGQDGLAGGKGVSTSMGSGVLGSATATPSSSSAADASNGETSGAAKAGIAIGVLGGLLLVALAVFFLFNKRKRQMEQERSAAGDEKVNGPMAARSIAGANGAMGAAGTAGAMGAAGAAGAAGLKRQDSLRSNHSVRAPATAPQVDLRPNSQFNPTFGERRSSKGAALALSMMAAAPSASSPRTPGQSPWERPIDKNQEDPFSTLR